tara:strand:- start:73 stop:975 length:903 start_codon:yes stop_codon:yes gene_type:complete
MTSWYTIDGKFISKNIEKFADHQENNAIININNNNYESVVNCLNKIGKLSVPEGTSNEELSAPAPAPAPVFAPAPAPKKTTDLEFLDEFDIDKNESFSKLEYNNCMFAFDVANIMMEDKQFLNKINENDGSIDADTSRILEHHYSRMFCGNEDKYHENIKTEMKKKFSGSNKDSTVLVDRFGEEFFRKAMNVTKQFLETRGTDKKGDPIPPTCPAPELLGEPESEPETTPAPAPATFDMTMEDPAPAPAPAPATFDMMMGDPESASAPAPAPASSTFDMMMGAPAPAPAPAPVDKGEGED